MEGEPRSIQQIFIELAGGCAPWGSLWGSRGCGSRTRPARQQNHRRRHTGPLVPIPVQPHHTVLPSVSEFSWWYFSEISSSCRPHHRHPLSRSSRWRHRLPARHSGFRIFEPRTVSLHGVGKKWYNTSGWFYPCPNVEDSLIPALAPLHTSAA